MTTQRPQHPAVNTGPKQGSILVPNRLHGRALEEHVALIPKNVYVTCLNGKIKSKSVSRGIYDNTQKSLGSRPEEPSDLPKSLHHAALTPPPAAGKIIGCHIAASSWTTPAWKAGCLWCVGSL